MDMVKELKAKIIKAQTSRDLAKEALDQFVNAAQEAIKDRDVFYVAISGGHTPTAFYELLSEKSAYSQIDWKKVHLFWVDERCVAPSAEASNFGLAVHTFSVGCSCSG